MKVTDEMIDAFGKSVWAHPWTDAGQTELSRSEVRDALQAVFDLIDAQERPPVHANPEMIYLRGVSHESTIIEISRRDYKQAKADDRLDHELDVYLSDMDSETYVVEPDGTVVYPYR